MVAARRLGPGDEAVITTLAKEDGAFDLESRSWPRVPITGPAATEYLSDQHVLHWVAEDERIVVGHLLCYLQRRRADEPRQLMLYEIGVRDTQRRQGIGRALLAEMEACMTKHRVPKVWVLADSEEAAAFYAACGFSRDDPQPAQMSRRL